MKCPHCTTGIAEAFADQIFFQNPQVMSRTGQVLAPAVAWSASFQRCPECHQVIVYLRRQQPPANAPLAPLPGWPVVEQFLANPRSASRPIAAEVPSPYRDDFSEACKVLTDSPKASAALSRRCLQAILKDKAGTKTKDLHDQIEEVISAKTLPSHIADDLHAVRQIGNIAAHSMKSTTTGAIVDVESGEAEWNLDALESLFDFFFIAPAADAKRKAALNEKLKAVGKPPLP